MPLSHDDLTIGRLSHRTGCKVETVRYYEKIGLLRDPPRTVGGHRLYSELDFRRLSFIRRTRELGFSISEVRELLALVDGGFTCGEVRDITLHHLDDVREKIADLSRLASTLESVAGRCKGRKAPTCPIVDALFDADAVRP